MPAVPEDLRDAPYWVVAAYMQGGRPAVIEAWRTAKARPRLPRVLKRARRCGPTAEHVEAFKARVAHLLESTDLMAPDVRRNDRFRWVTRGDALVCDVCSYMESLSGSFRVGDLLDQFDAFMEAMDEGLLEDELESAPFPSMDDVDGLGVKQLTEDGIISPPAHPHCRCRIVLV